MGKGRAPCCDKNQVKRGPWSPAEDLRLITFIQKHGHDNWRSLPKQAGLLRCGKSCRLRWINYLRPDVKRGNFTPDEEDAIIKLHKAWGNKWSKIASRLPGRTDNEIKNVWNTHLKKRLQPSKASDNNISGDDEAKQSPTSSSSSSSSLLSSNESQDLVGEQMECQTNKDSMAKQGLYEEVTNNQPTDDSKEQTSCSVLSFESANTSNSDTLWPEDPLMESQFEFVDININSKVVAEEEVEKKHIDHQLGLESSENVGMDIPFECDINFWNMLDLDNIELFQSDEAEVITRETETERLGFGGEEVENNKWIRYLENELGLDQQLPKEGEENLDLVVSTIEERENSGERCMDAQDLHWSKSNLDVHEDPCMAYFQMRSPLSPQQPYINL